mmetsp:Transcript_53235/g.159376  ORF Transcript_53235/g.159376 Transcript_53235/m.159376 type:complete len:227 (-) Transcript_53235:1610-2290(-)
MPLRLTAISSTSYVTSAATVVLGVVWRRPGRANPLPFRGRWRIAQGGTILVVRLRRVGPPVRWRRRTPPMMLLVGIVLRRRLPSLVVISAAASMRLVERIRHGLLALRLVQRTLPLFFRWRQRALANCHGTIHVFVRRPLPLRLLLPRLVRRMLLRWLILQRLRWWRVSSVGSDVRRGSPRWTSTIGIVAMRATSGSSCTRVGWLLPGVIACLRRRVSTLGLPVGM